MKPVIPTRPAFLLLCKDENVRWLVGNAWKYFVFESAAKLDAMLMCLEPFERHFDEKLREVNLLLYWDSANAFLAEIEWPRLPESSAVFRIGYTFKNRERMNEM